MGKLFSEGVKYWIQSRLQESILTKAQQDITIEIKTNTITNLSPCQVPNGCNETSCCCGLGEKTQILEPLYSIFMSCLWKPRPHIPNLNCANHCATWMASWFNPWNILAQKWKNVELSPLMKSKWTKFFLHDWPILKAFYC